jgi:hypothetical protein
MVGADEGNAFWNNILLGRAPLQFDARTGPSRQSHTKTIMVGVDEGMSFGTIFFLGALRCNLTFVTVLCINHILKEKWRARMSGMSFGSLFCGQGRVAFE